MGKNRTKMKERKIKEGEEEREVGGKKKKRKTRGVYKFCQTIQEKQKNKRRER